MSEPRDEFLSEEDLDLRNLSDEELYAYWDAWLEQAQATNDADAHTYSHGVFLYEPPGGAGPEAPAPAKDTAANPSLRVWNGGRIGLALMALVIGGFAAVSVGDDATPSSRSLAHTNQSGRDLRKANLRGADLTMADFSGADLRGADLTGANLDRINLDRADLRGVIGWAQADLGLGLIANGANFSGTDLRNAKVAGSYSGVYFEKADFTNADLRGATLAGRFHGARFDGATLTGTLMLGAGGVEPTSDDLRRRGAIVIGADFAAAVRAGRDFSGSLLRGAQLQDLDLRGVKLADADLQSARLDRTLLDAADLRGARLPWASAEGARFDGADLSLAHFDIVSAAGASFVGAKFIGASLSHARLSGANLRHVDLTGANLSNADLTGADLTGAILDDVTVEAAIFDNVQGVEPETRQGLRKRAGRWRYDVRMNVNDFLRNWSVLLHVMLTPAAVVLGLIGFRRTSARRSFAVMTAINLAAVAPLLIGVVFAMLGGSPTAQMSEPRLWSAWFHLWKVMMPAVVVLFFGSLAAGGYHIVRHIIMRPRNRPIWSLFCVLVTVANCFFAAQVLAIIAPDA